MWRRAARGRACALALLAAAAYRSAFVPWCAGPRGAPAPRREAVAAGGAALLAALAGGGHAARADGVVDFRSDRGVLLESEGEYDGYTFDKLGSPTGQTNMFKKMDKNYDKVKPVCNEFNMVVNGGATPGETSTNRIVCNTRERINNKEGVLVKDEELEPAPAPPKNPNQRKFGERLPR